MSYTTCKTDERQEAIQLAEWEITPTFSNYVYWSISWSSSRVGFSCGIIWERCNLNILCMIWRLLRGKHWTEIMTLSWGKNDWLMIDVKMVSEWCQHKRQYLSQSCSSSLPYFISSHGFYCLCFTCVLVLR